MKDGEVIGVDANGHVIQWNAAKRESYTASETLEQFGVHNLWPEERIRLRRQGVLKDIES